MTAHTLLCIPTEILIPGIFARIDYPDLEAISKTCRAFYRAAHSSYLLDCKRHQAAGIISHTLLRRPGPIELSLRISTPLRGLNLTERLLRGQYISTVSSVQAYYRSIALHRLLVSCSLSRSLSRRPTAHLLEERGLIETQRVSACLQAARRSLKAAFRRRDFSHKWKGLAGVEIALSMSKESSQSREFLCSGIVRRARQVFERLASTN